MQGKEGTGRMKIRVKFAKTGAMRFIGHLDVMRYFQKAIRRAEIDIAYSGGYSPHQIMSFAAPLGVGLTSSGEYMDIEVNSVTTSKDMKKKLNAVMVPGMEILNITMLEDREKNAMASVAAAAYTVRFRQGYEPETDWVGQMNAFYSQPSIMIKKVTKKSERELDLKPAIYEWKAYTDRTIYMLTDASSSGNVKPGLVMEAFMKWMGLELKDFSLQIKREDTFANRGTVEKPEFVPLDALGKEF